MNIELMSILLQVDTLVDTTSTGYRIGHSIGSWLPFLIIAGLVVLNILRQYRQSRE